MRKKRRDRFMRSISLALAVLLSFPMSPAMGSQEIMASAAIESNEADIPTELSNGGFEKGDFSGWYINENQNPVELQKFIKETSYRYWPNEGGLNVYGNGNYFLCGEVDEDWQEKLNLKSLDLAAMAIFPL